MILPHFRQNAEAIQLGHDNVQQKQGDVRAAALNDLKGLLAVGGF